MGLHSLGERQVDNRLLTANASADGLKHLLRHALQRHTCYSGTFA